MTEADWNDIVPTPNFIELHSVTLTGYSSSTSKSSSNGIRRNTHHRTGSLPRVFRQEDFHHVATAPQKTETASHHSDYYPPTSPTGRLFNSSRRIEFIGDSITAGYCNLCKELAPSNVSFNSPSNQSYALSWAQRTCEMFNADCHTEAWSGYGMAENCCGGNTTMPQIFNRTLASVDNKSSAWNFTSCGKPGCLDHYNNNEKPTGQAQWEAPQAVVINLGTNDFHSPAGKNISTNYTRNYFEMLRLLRRVYYLPEVRGEMQGEREAAEPLNVFLACGPMSTAYCNDVFTIINATGGVAPPNMTHHHHHNDTSSDPTTTPEEYDLLNVASSRRNPPPVSTTLLDDAVVAEYRAMDWFGLKAHFLDQRHVITKNNTCCGHPDVAADEHLAKLTYEQLNTILKWD